MKMKINRYEFDVTNKDIIMDNGAIYQCVTLTHDSHPYSGSYRYIAQKTATIMSKQQFNTLLKNKQIVYLEPSKFPNTYLRYLHSPSAAKLYRFNVE